MFEGNQHRGDPWAPGQYPDSAVYVTDRNMRLSLTLGDLKVALCIQEHTDEAAKTLLDIGKALVVLCGEQLTKADLEQLITALHVEAKGAKTKAALLARFR